MFFDRKPAAAAVPDLANLKVSDARIGDALSIAGAAPDFSDIDFNVDRVEYFEAGARRWWELSGMWRDIRVALEVHAQETLEVFGNFDGRRITLDELGVSEDDLAEIDQRQNQADFFDYNGKFWLYRFSREIGLFTNPNAIGRGFYCWEFQEQDSKRYLQIRKFEGEPFFGLLWTKLDPADITVYRGA
ncbi:MAG TPA: hypothetical protein VKX25_01735 [Bryobacteraceae bacterium]|jgi:hypothetical protein|nr:hypothetical protein [Bryobacteraceae bacterium]